MRLDFFRGIAMFIILIAHIPSNWLTLWIPARFGFSDATEMFVFCSGMASAIAFGKVFREQGHMMGSVRVAFRVWQVYWAHIGLFFAVAAAMVVLNNLVPDGRDYVGQLNLYPFFNRPQENLVGLLTLTYVPNYFDVLPMYLVILAMMPFVIALVGFNRWVAAAVLIAIWLSASVFDLNFPAEPWSERQWFFNPLGWQLVFFTGFALMAGWIPAPPVDWRLFAVAVLIVLVSVPFAYFRVYNEVEWFLEWRREWRFLFTKTDFGILRYVHFLSLAYIAWCLVGPKGARILPSETGGLFARIWQVILNAILKVGQQSLVVFVSSMFLARLLGALFDQVGRSHFSMAWVNILGALIIIALAYGVGWIKSQPWKQRKSAHAAP
ncbi:OpgC domain-containing protein [Cognatiyoonia sp. IB215182]|uniref:OpgC family protein n=1 Tax=Cognatiyoonia sp. IB215182 TaxID=3097353 RepID=UPI002A23F7B7|nr:OpgC domain-containing protein [Cognatiyoonia sp. IB215182]